MNDTASLLREVCQGCKYAIESIEIARKYATDERVASVLRASGESHKKIQRAASQGLKKEGVKEISHPAIGALMTKAQMNITLMLSSKPKSIAGVIIDGCNMGIKTVSKYKNRYPKASEECRGLADGLILAERELSSGMLKFL